MNRINIFITIIFIVIHSTIFSQNTMSNQIQGEWKLDKVNRVFHQSDSKNETNYFFYDAFVNHSMVTFTTSSIQLTRSGKVVVYDYKISDKELTIIFYSPDKSKQSYTTYNYEIKNGQLILRKEDPIISETYTFSK